MTFATTACLNATYMYSLYEQAVQIPKQFWMGSPFGTISLFLMNGV